MNNEDQLIKEYETKISEPYRNKEGDLVRDVNGKPVIQIEEETLEDVKANYNINMWRMR